METKYVLRVYDRYGVFDGWTGHDIHRIVYNKEDRYVGTSKVDAQFRRSNFCHYKDIGLGRVKIARVKQ